MKLTLHAYWRSSASWRVRIALGLKRCSYEVEPVNLLEGAQRQASHRERNPMMQVPTLVIDQDGDRRLLSQSLAICVWLDRVMPTPPLVPGDPYLAARAWELAEIINAGTQPQQNVRTLAQVEALGGDRTVWGRNAIEHGLSAFQARLPSQTKGPYCFGATPGLADVCLVPQLYNARRFEVPLEPFRRLLDIESACSALSAFESAVPEKQPDYVAS